MGLAWIAARIGDIALISELAKHQAELNKADNDGFTTAHIAALTGQPLVLDELIKLGADLSPSLISAIHWKKNLLETRCCFSNEFISAVS